MILCFSGTGNSRYVAEKIASFCDETVLDLNQRIKENDHSFIDENHLIFVTPTYAWRIPKAVEDFVLKTSFPKNAEVTFVMTCGSEIGNAAKYNQRLTKEKGWQYKGTAGVIMPENYIAMFRSPSEEEAKVIIQNAEKEIGRIASFIAAKKGLPLPRNNFYDKVMSDIVNPYFYKFCVKADPFYTKENCTRCGLCVKKCPFNNISLTDKGIKWGSHCTHCMSCIAYCPVEAIEYGDKSIGQYRYHL